MESSEIKNYDEKENVKIYFLSPKNNKKLNGNGYLVNISREQIK